MEKQPNLRERPKCRRDFSFLMDKTPIFVNQRVVKYMISQGEGKQIKQFVINPFNIYFSYKIYDYQGKLIQKNPIAKISTIKEQNQQLKQAILSMKINQQSWFNICNQPIPLQYASSQDLQKRSGCHYEIVLNQIQFHNSDKIQIIRTINVQNREKAIVLLKDKKYFEAGNALKKIMRATQKVNSRLYSEEQLGQIQTININAKLRYLDCYFNIQNTVIQISLQKFTMKVIEWLNKRQIHHPYHQWFQLKNTFQGVLEKKKSRKLEEDNTKICE